MKRTIFALMLLTVISKLIGFTRDIILSYYYGASNISDAFLISQTIPVVIFTFIGTGISTGFIPMYKKVMSENGMQQSKYFINNLINITLVTSLILSIIGFFYADFLVSIFAKGFYGETFNLAVKFTKISIFGIIFLGLTHIFDGYLQANNSFNAPAIAVFPMNITIIIFTIISYYTNPIVMVIGGILAIILQVFFLSFNLKKHGYEYKLIMDLKDRHIRRFLLISIPVILGISVNEINVLVDRTIASSITIGGISALNYASRLSGFVRGLFVVSISTVMYPVMSDMITNNNLSGFKKSLSESVVAVSLFVLPTTLGTIILSEPIVSFLFGRGAFDNEAIKLTSIALFYYSFGIVFFGLREVLSRAFYSMQDTKTPMINAVVGMSLNIILNLILSRFLGIGGLALATSLSAMFTTLLLLISLLKKIGPFGMKQIIISFLKILFASLLMGVIAKISFNYLTSSLSQNLSLLIAIGVGTVSYFLIIYFMKIEDVDVIVGAIKKKLGRATA